MRENGSAKAQSEQGSTLRETKQQLVNERHEDGTLMESQTIAQRQQA